MALYSIWWKSDASRAIGYRRYGRPTVATAGLLVLQRMQSEPKSDTPLVPTTTTSDGLTVALDRRFQVVLNNLRDVLTGEGGCPRPLNFWLSENYQKSTGFYLYLLLFIYVYVRWQSSPTAVYCIQLAYAYKLLCVQNVLADMTSPVGPEAGRGRQSAVRSESIQWGFGTGRPGKGPLPSN